MNIHIDSISSVEKMLIVTDRSVSPLKMLCTVQFLPNNTVKVNNTPMEITPLVAIQKYILPYASDKSHWYNISLLANKVLNRVDRIVLREIEKKQCPFFSELGISKIANFIRTYGG